MRAFRRSAAALTGLILLASTLPTLATPAIAAPVAQEEQSIVEPLDPTVTESPAAEFPVGPQDGTTPEPQTPAVTEPAAEPQVTPAPEQVTAPEVEPTQETQGPAVSEPIEGAPRSIHTYEDGYNFETNGQILGEQGGAAARVAPQDIPATMEAASQRQGAINVKLVTVRLADNASQVSMANAVNSVNVASNYWKSMSNNRLSMAVTSQVAGHQSQARSTWSYQDIMNQVTNELRWTYSPYSALVVFIPSSLPGGILGYGWSSNGTSGRILMPQMSEFTTNVVTHEFGHVLGLMHADALQCTRGQSDIPTFAGSGCSIREYGDTLDLMGSARWYDTPVISSSFWDYGKFGRGDEIRNVGVASGRKTYTLTPWAGTAANRAVKFTDPKSREVYYLELRAPVGYDRNVAVNGNFGVKVVQLGGSAPNASLILMPNTRPFAGYYATNHTWKQGQTFTTHAGTSVTINSLSTGSATVTINTNAPAPAPLPTPSTPVPTASQLFFRGVAAAPNYFGASNNQFLACDWNGNGVSTPATFSNGVWTFRQDLASTATTRAVFGAAGDQPICGDWDGDGRETIGIYRQGVAMVRNNNTSGAVDGTIRFGARGDVALVGDWNGDGYATLGVSRATTSGKRFYLTNSNLAPGNGSTFLFGNSSDTAIAGDWDNDGYTTVGLKRGGTWFKANSNIQVRTNTSYYYGNPGDKPLVGSWRSGTGDTAGVVR